VDGQGNQRETRVPRIKARVWVVKSEKEVERKIKEMRIELFDLFKAQPNFLWAFE
jgi:hypothetical protein